MPENLIPRKVQNSVKDGFDQLKRYRLARAMFVKEFVGRYYQKNKGVTGEQPLNLIFHTIRTFVPNLVMQNPSNEITTPYLAHQDYGELLALGIDSVQTAVNYKDTLRAWIVAALFGLGIVKTGLAATGEMLQFGDADIDPGQVYTKLIDLDDFVLDPVCTELSTASFMGSRIRTPRQMLLDTDGYDHDNVLRLPKSKFEAGNKVEDIGKTNTAHLQMNALQDFVDVVELWVPEANAIVTISDPSQIIMDKYLRTMDFYGPKTGPYTFLSFTPPVPNNPLPVSPVSIWYDIHKMANRTLARIMDQADRQKDVMLYDPAQSDEAQDIVEAADGDTIATTNPQSFQIASYGGQNRDNGVMLQELQMWYNYMSGNPDQVAGNMTRGTKGSKETATRSSIMQSNANVNIEDARSILYDRASEVSEKIAWYLHTDPLINLPLIKRTSGGAAVQLTLTPEQRCGDFTKFVFKIKARSMSRLDPTIKSKRVMEFATNIIPSIMNAAMVSMQMGMPYNVRRTLTDIAKELEILETVVDWFDDPEFQQKMNVMLAMGPQNAGKAAMGPGSTEQNNGAPMARPILTPGQENNQNAQMGAAPGQSAMQGAY